MIRKDNLESMLQAIGYIRGTKANVYEKRYSQYDCTIKVDFNGSGSIIYLIIGIVLFLLVASYYIPAISMFCSIVQANFS